MDAALLHQALLDPASYPVPPERIDFIETHISRLYLTPQRVYKLKKPVNFGFLNFSTLERRHHFCTEEVRLNRRFAPQTYLGVLPLRAEGGRVRIGGEHGELLDYLVEMERLPAERMLLALLADGDPQLPEALERLGQTLGELHRAAPVCRREEERYADAVRHNWNESFAQIAPLTGPTITAPALALLRHLVDEQLVHLTPLLAERESLGLVRDGHGDLHAEHVCLTDPPRIYDCIEFNRRFRVADILADIAFLLMDLDFRGRRDLAARVYAGWRGALDLSDLPDLRRFYQIYRAVVRGKVDTFLACDPAAATATRAAAATLARRYFNLALGYLAPPHLIMVCGLMGTGKTTLARELANALGAVHLRSDLLRKELLGDGAGVQREDPFGQGLYTPQQTRRTYRLLLEETERHLASGATVIVDASFAAADDRSRFRRVAARRKVPCLLLQCRCSDALALERLDRRRQAGSDASDGRPELYRLQAERFVPPSAEEEALALDTAAEVDACVQQVLTALLTPAGL